MPGFDQSGPMGAGPMTGGTRGYCNPVNTGIPHSFQRRGFFGRGLRRGLGMFGVVGWSVAIPTLIGVAVGIWIDRSWPSQFSWTLMLLIGGLMLGCMNAWYWVRKGGIQK